MPVIIGRRELIAALGGAAARRRGRSQRARSIKLSRWWVFFTLRRPSPLGAHRSVGFDGA
jgi:hypothetical protein